MTLSAQEKQLIGLITEAIVGLLAIYNGFIAPMYNLPNMVIATENINAIVCFIVVVAVVIWNTWKNRNFTYAAKLGQMVVDGVKNGVLAPEVVEEMLDEAEEEYQTNIDALNADIEKELNAEQAELNAEIEQEVEQFMDTTGSEE